MTSGSVQAIEHLGFSKIKCAFLFNCNRARTRAKFKRTRPSFRLSSNITLGLNLVKGDQGPHGKANTRQNGSSCMTLWRHALRSSFFKKFQPVSSDMDVATLYPLNAACFATCSVAVYRSPQQSAEWNLYLDLSSLWRGRPEAVGCEPSSQLFGAWSTPQLPSKTPPPA